MSNKLRKYIPTQPQLPEGFRYRVPILVTDSKGYSLRDACTNYEFPLEQWCVVGARTSQLVNVIQERIEKALARHQFILIYLWAGTCDITYKKGKYIYLRHKSNHSVNNIVQEYYRAIDIIQKYPNADIKFIDCPILSITKWNRIKGHKDSESFKNDDSLATHQIKLLNKRIWQINSTLKKASVRVSRYFFRCRKRQGKVSRKSVVLSINNKDGVHPGKLLSLAITKHILLDTYIECYNILDESEYLQITVAEEEILSLF